MEGACRSGGDRRLGPRQMDPHPCRVANLGPAEMVSVLRLMGLSGVDAFSGRNGVWKGNGGVNHRPHAYRTTAADAHRHPPTMAQWISSLRVDSTQHLLVRPHRHLPQGNALNVCTGRATVRNTVCRHQLQRYTPGRWAGTSLDTLKTRGCTTPGHNEETHFERSDTALLGPSGRSGLHSSLARPGRMGTACLRARRFSGAGDVAAGRADCARLSAGRSALAESL